MLLTSVLHLNFRPFKLQTLTCQTQLGSILSFLKAHRNSMAHMKSLRKHLMPTRSYWKLEESFAKRKNMETQPPTFSKNCLATKIFATFAVRPLCTSSPNKLGALVQKKALRETRSQSGIECYVFNFISLTSELKYGIHCSAHFQI